MGVRAPTGFSEIKRDGAPEHEGKATAVDERLREALRPEGAGRVSPGGLPKEALQVSGGRSRTWTGGFTTPHSHEWPYRG